MLLLSTICRYFNRHGYTVSIIKKHKMATKISENVIPVPKIESIPNLRLLCKRSNSSVDKSPLVNSGALYRSSKPDRVTVADLDEFRKLGIKTIIDFRSKEEYMLTDGQRLLDKEYALYTVILPKNNYIPGQPVEYELISDKDNIHTSKQSEKMMKSDTAATVRSTTTFSNNVYNQKEDQLTKRHFFINFFSFKYVKVVFNRLPWHLWCLGLLHFVWDIIVWNNFKTAKKFVASKAISAGGIFGQYTDIINVSQPAICAALKLISDSENLPAMINCAFGKDRTGIMSALILTCLGMPKDFVVEEYAMSTEGLQPIKHLMCKEIVEKHYLTEEFCTSNAVTMRSLLTYIEDRYQSVEEYMISIGFTKQDQMRLKDSLEAFDHKFHK